MNRESIPNHSASPEGVFPDENAFHDGETKSELKKAAYTRAEELLSATIEGLTGGNSETKTDYKGRVIRPHNYIDIFDAKNALLAIKTGSADSTVREVLVSELDRSEKLLKSLNEEYAGDGDWQSSPAKMALDAETDVLKKLLTALTIKKFDA